MRTILCATLVGLVSSFRPLETSLRLPTSLSSTLEQPRIIQHRDTYDRESWTQGFSSVKEETCFELKGKFPADLKGTFFQNGPAKFEVGDEIVVHQFDADGHISAITFDDGKAWFRNRYVRTPGFVKEQETQKVSGRGVFGTAKNKGKWWSNIFDVSFKKVANTHVLFRNNRLFALWEASLPFEINPVTLETLGETRIDDTLAADDRYSAHYSIDPRNGNVVNFAIMPGDSLDPNENHNLLMVEHDKDMNLVYRTKHVIPGFGLAHDCTISENYLGVFQAPSNFDPLPFVLGQKGVGQCITWDNEATSSKFHLVPRTPDGQVISIDVPKTFNFHVANMFEDADGTVVCDVVLADFLMMADTQNTVYPEKPLWETVDFASGEIPKYSLTRIRVDPKQATLVSFEKLTESAAATVDFPAIHPDYISRPYSLAYIGCSASATDMSPLQGLLKLNVQTGEALEKWLPAEEHEYLSEFVFVPRGEGEEDGYLLGYKMDAKNKKTSVVLFDAKNLSQGPVVESELDIFLPHALHGTFVPGFTPKMVNTAASR